MFVVRKKTFKKLEMKLLTKDFEMANLQRKLEEVCPCKDVSIKEGARKNGFGFPIGPYWFKKCNICKKEVTISKKQFLIFHVEAMQGALAEIKCIEKGGSELKNRLLRHRKKRFHRNLLNQTPQLL